MAFNDLILPLFDARAHRRVHSPGLPAACATLLLVACVDPVEVSQIESEIRVCADGPTVEGIDVSKWQGEIDWDTVAAGGTRFAFIRTSHGLDILDEWYDFNWTEARRVGVMRGTYQYFAPAADPIAQADMLLDRMGPLELGDLPPVLDVEEADGATAAEIVAGIEAWSGRIEAALGVKPIIYTAKYFWQDNVGAPDQFLDHSLWVANYTTDCPLIADPWPRWDFWQYTGSGSVAGVTGAIDRDVWNGTEDELRDFGWAPAPPDMPPPDMPPPDMPPPDGTAAGGCSAAPGHAGSAGHALALLVGLALVRRRRRRAPR